MRTILILIVLASHVAASLPFWSALRKRAIPSTADFACLSVLVFYDLGLVLEMFGYPYKSDYFTSLFQVDIDTFLTAVIFLLLVPWLFRLGAAVARRGQQLEPQEPVSTLKPELQWRFYALSVAVLVPITLYGATHLHSGQGLWTSRFNVAMDLGPLIIILYLPLHFLAFYLRQASSRTIRGLLFAALLAASAALSTIVMAERSVVLLPFATLALFRFRITAPRLILGGAGLIVLAALMLTTFKWQYAEKQVSPDELVANTISADISRAGVLATAVQLSPPVGTTLMPYPGAGYVYSFLFFVPRQVAPFKGYPSAQYFTSRVADIPLERTNWGFGEGAIEESMLNLGLMLAVPFLLLYGMGMGLADRATRLVPELVIPTRLAGLWICGYDLPAVLQLFAVMALICLLLHHLFARRQPLHEGGKVETGKDGKHALRADRRGLPPTASRVQARPPLLPGPAPQNRPGSRRVLGR